ncbi:MAG: hypothetical protein FGM54_08640 [Chitinophagaceae bacterium]|nr:hypothetical protein [Chitinophagaceae bacterium]
MPSFIVRVLSVLGISAFLIACKNEAPDVVSVASNSSINMRSEGPVEMIFGQSGYIVNLPGIYTITEAKGKEGQLGYTISSQDSSNHVFGFVEIKKGLGIKPKSTAGDKPFIKALFNGDETQWMMHRTETGYFEAYTPTDREIRALVSSDREKEVRELVMLLATFRKG